MSPGAPKGNDNATKHGLTSRQLWEKAFGEDSIELAFFRSLEHTDAATAARQMADVLMSQIIKALSVAPELDAAKGELAAALRNSVAAGRMDPKTAERLLAKLHQPDVATVGKALAPLKGLLARLDAEEDAKRNTPTGLIVIAPKGSDWADPSP